MFIPQFKEILFPTSEGGRSQATLIFRTKSNPIFVTNEDDGVKLVQ